MAEYIENVFYTTLYDFNEVFPLQCSIVLLVYKQYNVIANKQKNSWAVFVVLLKYLYLLYLYIFQINFLTHNNLITSDC